MELQVDNDKLIYQHVNWRMVVPKIIVNAFPKAGTHMAVQMVSPLASPVRNPLVPEAWVGNIGGNGFWNTQNQLIGEHEQYERLALCMPGQFYKSHSVYKQVYANFINMCGYAMIFMYRDLRDVAVSWAHHILDKNPKTLHPAKQFFKMLELDGGFEEVLLAVINGAGPLPGVVDHWGEFAPWLDQEWVLPIKYEDMRQKPGETADKVFRYLIDRSGEVRSMEWKISAVAKMKMQEMADATKKREASPTFRKGIVGGWQDEWTESAADAFEVHGGNEWLEKLGYTESKPDREYSQVRG